MVREGDRDCRVRIEGGKEGAAYLVEAELEMAKIIVAGAQQGGVHSRQSDHKTTVDASGAHPVRGMAVFIQAGATKLSDEVPVSVEARRKQCTLAKIAESVIDRCAPTRAVHHSVGVAVSVTDSPVDIVVPGDA